MVPGLDPRKVVIGPLRPALCVQRSKCGGGLEWGLRRQVARFHHEARAREGCFCWETGGRKSTFFCSHVCALQHHIDVRPNAPHHPNTHRPITRAHAQYPYVLCNKNKGSVSSTPCLKKWIVSMSCLHVLECGGKTKFKQHEPSPRRKMNLTDDDDTPCALHSRKRHWLPEKSKQPNLKSQHRTKTHLNTWRSNSANSRQNISSMRRDEKISSTKHNANIHHNGTHPCTAHRTEKTRRLSLSHVNQTPLARRHSLRYCRCNVNGSSNAWHTFPLLAGLLCGPKPHHQSNRLAITSFCQLSFHSWPGSLRKQD